MPLYFLIFLAMLAASLLLYLGAAATLAITRRSPPGWIPKAAANPLQAASVASL
jgi:hypothetical protein